MYEESYLLFTTMKSLYSFDTFSFIYPTECSGMYMSLNLFIMSVISIVSYNPFEVFPWDY